jgi:MoaA/NifB/PqqE/SkfB family radical SAM enzyme
MGISLKEKAKRAAFNKAVDLSFSHIKKDPEKGILDVVKIFDDYLVPDSLEQNSGKLAIEAMKRELSDPTSKWMSFGVDIVNEIHENVIKHFVTNVGYNAAYMGNNIRCELMKENDCNIPWAILFDPTSACNLHCTGCWAAEYGHKNNLTYDEMASIVRQGNELGTYFFILTGGEPLVRKKDIIRLADEFNDSEFHIFTNGTLIDDEFCKEVQRVGNISFAMSIEGTEESTDSRRGEGVYKQVIRAMDLMKKYKLLYGVSICYTSVNYKYVTDDDFIQMLVDHGCKLAWYFHYMPVGNDADTSLLLTPEQRTYVYKKVRKIRSRDYHKNIFTIDFQNDGEYIHGCIAGGRNYFHINSAGDIEPCVFIHYSDSNIREKTIVEALKSPLFMAYHRNQPFNDNLLKPCPMLENPGRLTKMVNDTGAHSTDMISPETPENLEKKCRPYARAWNETADELWDKSLHNPKNKEELDRVRAEEAARDPESSDKDEKSA